MKLPIFQNVGYSVLAEYGGVYHIRHETSLQGGFFPNEAVAVLVAYEEVTVATKFVELVVLPYSEGMPRERMMIHMQNLKASRLVSTGLNGFRVPVPALCLDATPEDYQHARPEGTGRIRHGGRLCTGEVVCYS